MQAPDLRVRRSFREIENDHKDHCRRGVDGLSELDKVIKAFHYICVTLGPENPNSFFIIGGYHGEPFRGAGWGNPLWWGGYCYHGQILFPTWHRAYCKRLEDALRTAPECGDVTLPFLDWCDHDTKVLGLPKTLTNTKYEYSDGTTIDNPLYSYRFQKGVFDNVPVDLDNEVYDYTKLKGYCTCRYPYSGLVGGDSDQQAATKKWNDRFIGCDTTDLLNDNIVNWLRIGDPEKKKPEHGYLGVSEKFENCLDAPNFTVFSNTTSAHQYNQDNLNEENPEDDPNKCGPTSLVIPLESPHNAMHLAVGGFTAPVQGVKTVSGANGDMGENNTAGLDPIFFLHHAYVDRIFWIWQQRHGQTQRITIDPEFKMYPGTNNMDDQGPVAGATAGVQLTLDTPLAPFKLDDGTNVTSYDVINIIDQMGYKYGPGSFDILADPKKHLLREAPKAEGHIAISGINRAKIRGSFVVKTYYKDNLIAAEPILSRNNVQGCANCQSHLDVKIFAPILKLNDGRKDTFHGDTQVIIQPHGESYEWAPKGSQKKKYFKLIPHVKT